MRTRGTADGLKEPFQRASKKAVGEFKPGSATRPPHLDFDCLDISTVG
jgi:hypothetical protein